MTEEKSDLSKEKVSLDDGSLEELEKDFKEVLQELKGDQNLEKFKTEYEKLHKALLKSHESEKRLMQKCRELNAEFVANSAKVSTALKLSNDDQATIQNLKKEIEKAWDMVDQAHTKENEAKETIQKLKQEINNLSKLVEQGAGLSVGHEHSVNELLSVKVELTRERDEALQEIWKLREKNAEAQDKEQKLEQELEQARTKIQELQQDIQSRSNEIQRENRKKDKLERELRQAKAELDSKVGEMKVLQQNLESSTSLSSKVSNELKEQKESIARHQKDTDALQFRLAKLQQDFEAQLHACDQLNSENQLRTMELKTKEDEINRLRQESQRLNKLRDGIHRKLREAENFRVEIEQQKEILKNQVLAMERELEGNMKQSEVDKKKLEELMRERDMLSKNMLKSAAQTLKQTNLAKLHEQSKYNLEHEIQNYKDEAQKQRKIIYQLEKERDRYINEASDLTQKVLQHMEDVKVREMEIFDYKKKIAEAETKLRQQQNLYEAVRSDRNLYSKNLIESQDEITEMKRKLKIMNHQIDQLKDEISSKEASLVKEHLEHQRVNKEKEALKSELQMMKQVALDTKGHMEALEGEEKKLLKIISEADAEKLRQKKELDQVITERNILGTQLVRRNDELALLYEKIKIQQSTLNKGEVQYNQRLEDIRVLKLEIRKLRRERLLLQKSVANVDDLRREVYHLQRELLRERTRCKALEEELENPMNIHRWRKLEGSDPGQYEMVQKMQMLQKRLIAKTEEVVEKELMIQEKEKLYIELKHILARQPGPEVAEQLQIYQNTIKEKAKQMKVMASELNMYETQISEYKYEIERLNRDLQEVKKKYFMQKKKEHHSKDQERALVQAGMPIIPAHMHPDQARFTGGGFSLRQVTANHQTVAA